MYFDEVTGDVSTKHPKAGFYKKTFSKIVQSKVHLKNNTHVSKIVVDKASKFQIEKRVSENFTVEKI